MFTLLAVLGQVESQKPSWTGQPMADPGVTGNHEVFDGTLVIASGTVVNSGCAIAYAVRVELSVVDNGVTIGHTQKALGDLPPGAQIDYSMSSGVSAEPGPSAETVVGWHWSSPGKQCPNGIAPLSDPNYPDETMCGSETTGNGVK
jgi:hypothetical protein